MSTKVYIGSWVYPVNEKMQTVKIGGKDVPLNIALQVPFSKLEKVKNAK